MTVTPVELILASASPRRRELIALLGLPHRVVPSRYDEPPAPNYVVSLPQFVMELAGQKAMEVAIRLGAAWVLGADTIVSLDEGEGVPLGKPMGESDAVRMLGLLSGRTHFVYTGIALVPPWTGDRPTPVTLAVRTGVRFRELTQTMIEDYVATGEPLDKAGAYGAQGYAAPFIEHFDGDFFNVVGLPLCSVGRLLEQCGLGWDSWRRQTLLSAADAETA